MFQSTEIIGRNQYNFAKNLYTHATEELTGKVDYRLSYLDMPAVQVMFIFPPHLYLWNRLRWLMVQRLTFARLPSAIPSLPEQLMDQA